MKHNLDFYNSNVRRNHYKQICRGILRISQNCLREIDPFIDQFIKLELRKELEKYKTLINLNQVKIKFEKIKYLEEDFKLIEQHFQNDLDSLLTDTKFQEKFKITVFFL
jgi:hypothetical protein